MTGWWQWGYQHYWVPTWSVVEDLYHTFQDLAWDLWLDADLHRS